MALLSITTRMNLLNSMFENASSCVCRDATLNVASA